MQPISPEDSAHEPLAPLGRPMHDSGVPTPVSSSPPLRNDYDGLKPYQRHAAGHCSDVIGVLSGRAAAYHLRDDRGGRPPISMVAPPREEPSCYSMRFRHDNRPPSIAVLDVDMREEGCSRADDPDEPPMSACSSSSSTASVISDVFAEKEAATALALLAGSSSSSSGGDYPSSSTPSLSDSTPSGSTNMDDSMSDMGSRGKPPVNRQRAKRPKPKHECPHCDAFFDRKWNLSNHVKIHNVDR
ncbi:hypothetical protein HK101_003880, partial [Irineochytrium annulatum]